MVHSVMQQHTHEALSKASLLVLQLQSDFRMADEVVVLQNLIKHILCTGIISLIVIVCQSGPGGTAGTARLRHQENPSTNSSAAIQIKGNGSAVDNNEL